MERQQKLLQQLTDAMDLPGETGAGKTVTELLGNDRLIIEYHKGIIDYSSDRIIVIVSYGNLSIYGSGLELKNMTSRQLIISGQIYRVEIGDEDSL